MCEEIISATKKLLIVAPHVRCRNWPFAAACAHSLEVVVESETRPVGHPDKAVFDFVGRIEDRVTVSDADFLDVVFLCVREIVARCDQVGVCGGRAVRLGIVDGYGCTVRREDGLDAQKLGDTADFHDIGLDDIGASLGYQLEVVPAGEGVFALCDRHVEGVGDQGHSF